MGIPGYRRLTVFLGALCVALVVLYGFLFWSYGWLKISVAFAGEQSQISDEMRIRAIQSDTTNATRCLEYVINYYPSGTKQLAGSRLDRMVERERAVAVNAIMNYLHDKTGDDLGAKPEAWIQRYAKR